MDNNSIINLSYDVEYYNYKIFVNEQISKQYDIIFNIFDNTLNENLVKLYILLKKNKLDEECKLYVNSIFELIFDLKKIDKSSTIIFLDILISIIKVTLVIPNLIKLFNNNKYSHLINIEIIKLKFNNLIEELSKNNLLAYNLNRLLTINNNSDKVKEIIESLIKILACEYFMNYNSLDLLNLINDKLKIVKNNLILVNLTKYKKKFIHEYNELSLKYNDLYFDIKIMINRDYKYNIMNKFFLEMINDIKIIESIQ